MELPESSFSISVGEAWFGQFYATIQWKPLTMESLRATQDPVEITSFTDSTFPAFSASSVTLVDLDAVHGETS